MGYHNNQNLEEILEKYWKGETTLEEEMWLKESQELIQTQFPNELTHELFAFQELESNQTSNLSFEALMAQLQPVQPVAKRFQLFSLKQWLPGIAASLILIAGAYFLMKPATTNTSNQELAMVETYDDPQQAYEEVKRALLILTETINKTSVEVADQLDKTEQYTNIFK